VRCGGASGSARKKIFRITRSDRFLGGNARSLNDHQGIFHPCCRRSIRTSTGFPRTEIALSQVAPVQSSLRWSMPKRHDIAVVPTCVSRSPPHDRHERSIAWLSEKLFSGPQVRRWNVFASISFHRAQPQSRRWLVPPPTAPWNQKVSLWGSRGGDPKAERGRRAGQPPVLGVRTERVVGLPFENGHRNHVPPSQA
jgi:hypothetical protein